MKILVKNRTFLPYSYFVGISCVTVFIILTTTTTTTLTTAQRLDSFRLSQPPTDLPDARTTPHRVAFSPTAPEKYTSVLDSYDQDDEEDPTGMVSPPQGKILNRVVLTNCLRNPKASSPLARVVADAKML